MAGAAVAGHARSSEFNRLFSNVALTGVKIETTKVLSPSEHLEH
jgi:hypothetical protein